MKHYILIIILLLNSCNLFAQNPDFENVWVLDYIYTNGVNTEPPINSEMNEVTLITSISSINTMACDDITSPIENLSNISFRVTGFMSTQNNCSLPETLLFQEVYFGGFFKMNTPGVPFGYMIDTDDNGNKTLRLENIDNEFAYYTQRILAVPDHSSLSYKIYPNPTATSLTIKTTDGSPVSTLEIFDFSGKRVLVASEAALAAKTISVENLQNGIYFLKLKNAAGKRSVLKFVKQ